ncbi:MAG TPA: helical backbone metal receptor [Candidatus Cloacimonas sp.]|nr:helical backbone metal receptor [Candidatus Cloacimonas sp.]
MKKSGLPIIIIIILFTFSCKQSEKNQKKGIVVLSPEVAEIICALNAENEITGITAECNYPPSLQQKKIVGSFSSIDKEAIIALNPRLIFCSSLEQESIALDLKNLGFQVEVIYPESINAMFSDIERIGTLIRRKEAAEKLVKDLKEEKEKIKANSQGKLRPKVYLEIYRNPLMSVSDSSFVGELIETAGGDNIFPRLERDYARINPEAVISAKPDIMICYSQDTLENIINRKGWQNIPAIQKRKIFFEKDINPDLIQRATPRCIEGMKILSKLFEDWQKEQ